MVHVITVSLTVLQSYVIPFCGLYFNTWSITSFLQTHDWFIPRHQSDTCLVRTAVIISSVAASQELTSHVFSLWRPRPNWRWSDASVSTRSSHSQLTVSQDTGTTLAHITLLCSDAAYDPGMLTWSVSTVLLTMLRIHKFHRWFNVYPPFGFWKV